MPRSKAIIANKYKAPAARAAPAVLHVQEKQGFFSNVLQGFGLGAGQAIAHNIFRSDPVVTHKQETTPKEREYMQCMKEYQDAETCKKYLE
jgi:hypothetical protein